MAQIVIFGAGKIARGFLGHLMYNSGMDFAFVEKSDTLVQLMRERGRYGVRVLGAGEKNAMVTGYRIVATEDDEGVAREMQDAQVMFTAVGGKNLIELAPVIAKALKSIHPRVINVVTCENWKKPAAILKQEIAAIDPEIEAGFAESVVMRSAIEPDAGVLAEDPLAVNVQDYWHLPVDADALIGELPRIPFIEPMQHFQGFLERKFYTYNAANGTVSFLGALLGHRHIADAAWDVRIQPILEQVYLETGRALSMKYGVSLEDQLAFAGTSRDKLRNRVIVDNIERNARDPMRKLGPDDRLVGSARLVQHYGIVPEGLATAIAAAIHYVSPGDPSAEELARLVAEKGNGYVLENICKIAPEDELYRLVLKKEKELEAKEWIR